MIEIPFRLGERSYPVLIGAGVRHRLTERLPMEAKRAVVVTQPGVPVEVDPGVPFERVEIGLGEGFKTLETVEDLCRVFVATGLTRKDVVVAVGGGLVTDLAGFAAAIYHRGTPFINVPTTLLGQVDAALGGKTGVNLPEGKNLVGAFWQPDAVLCDTEVLQTLPEREYRSGAGEMAKYHFLARALNMDASALVDMNIDDKVAFCVQLKANVVEADEREGGLRNILNYGHTLGHAIEIAGHFDLRHGEAVAIGLHFAALLANRLRRIPVSRVQDHLDVLAFYNLEPNLPADADIENLIDLMGRDKKAMNGLTFILDSENGPEMVSNVDVNTVRSVLKEMPRS